VNLPVGSYKKRGKQLLRELNNWHSINGNEHERRALFDGLDLLWSVKKDRLGSPEAKSE